MTALIESIGNIIKTGSFKHKTCDQIRLKQIETKKVMYHQVSRFIPSKRRINTRIISPTTHINARNILIYFFYFCVRSHILFSFE